MVCVIGDGALTGGMAYEALNDAGQSGEPLVVVYNDNEMSISPNVGAVAKRLSKIRLKPQYINLKRRVKALFRRYQWGEKAIAKVSASKRKLRSVLLRQTIFDLMGFTYLGPADGNDIKTVKYLLTEAKKLHRPVVLHSRPPKARATGHRRKTRGIFTASLPLMWRPACRRKKSSANFPLFLALISPSWPGRMPPSVPSLRP